MERPILTLKSIDGWVERGERGFCWRSECRAVNRQYHTVTYKIGPLVIAHCHRGEYRTLLDLCVELSAHAG
jgi:hypothetical protein